MKLHSIFILCLIFIALVNVNGQDEKLKYEDEEVQAQKLVKTKYDLVDFIPVLKSLGKCIKKVMKCGWEVLNIGKLDPFSFNDHKKFNFNNKYIFGEYDIYKLLLEDFSNFEFNVVEVDDNNVDVTFNIHVNFSLHYEIDDGLIFGIISLYGKGEIIADIDIEVKGKLVGDPDSEYFSFSEMTMDESKTSSDIKVTGILHDEKVSWAVGEHLEKLVEAGVKEYRDDVARISMVVANAILSLTGPMHQTIVNTGPIVLDLICDRIKSP